MKWFFLFSLVLVGVLLGGCASERMTLPVDVPAIPLPSLGDMPFVHKIDIQQGNVVTQDMIAQLQLGMDKKKVNFVMGSPVIQDTFHGDRWDYLYMSSIGGERARRRRITLYFNEGLLDRVEGDITPATGRLIVDTRQDSTVEVPDAQKAGLIAKITDSIPFVGEEAPKRRPKAAEALPVVDESLPPDAVRDAPAPPQLTPIERAALEEQGGPGVLAKLKDAIPFTGDAKATPSRRPATAPSRVADEDDEPASSDAAAPELTTDASPGLLSKLKSALPFSGADAADAESSADETAAEAPDAPDAQEEYQEEDAAFATDATNDDERADEGEDYDAVFVPPPVAPTAGPLENRIAGPAEESDEGVEVPREATSQKRGFFARLFGRDRPEDDGTEPDARERRRYRDLSDPEAD